MVIWVSSGAFSFVCRKMLAVSSQVFSSFSFNYVGSWGLALPFNNLLWFSTLHRFEHAHCHQEEEVRVLLHQHCSIVPVSEKSEILFFLMGADRLSLEVLFIVSCSSAVLPENSHSPEVWLCNSALARYWSSPFSAAFFNNFFTIPTLFSALPLDLARVGLEVE